MGKPISDYAIIDDTRSCALIGRDSGIDWLSWPRHDNPALLILLPDDPQGGEEIDAASSEQRGNLPQGFTHMCVINHAVRLELAVQQTSETKEVA